MLEWLFFLLPIAALSGWLVARNQYKKTANTEESLINPDYFKGLNYLLNEQPDKAIDVFIRLLEVNSETVDTHLALANLFRRRGETERAIRIHQNLIARPTLDTQQRSQALLELGMDYMSAGVLDRAEALFLELKQQAASKNQACKQLLRIYQKEKSWDKAIEAAKELIPTQTSMGTQVTHFYCELAQQKLTTASKQATYLISQAQRYDKNCVRANLLEADTLMLAKQFQKAQKVLSQIEQQNIDYFSEALPKLYICYQQMNRLADFETWLKSFVERHPQLDYAKVMLADLLQQLHGQQAQQQYLCQQLETQTSLPLLNQLILTDTQPQINLTPLVKRFTSHMIENNTGYTCQQCGFAGKTMHWQCPSCGRWQTIHPNTSNSIKTNGEHS
jgi:lipopolysaccharide biosynthesis regulator YciM